MTSDFELQYRSLWKSKGGPPDLGRFLTDCGEVNSAIVIELVLIDQERRWQLGKPMRVEDYVATVPALKNDSAMLVRLAVGEFRNRTKFDDAPNLDEYLARFSEVQESLSRALASEVEEPTIQGSRTYLSGTPDAREVLDRTRSVRSLPAGRKGGRYRLDSVLGEGGFGRVYLAFDEELRRQVAIKVPTAARFTRPEDAEIYLAEARHVASLDHPNIVPVYDTGHSSDGSIYLISKFIQGCTLKEKIKSDRPDPSESARLVATIARALEHAHQRGLIHRDVKPGNILLELSTGTPYVADFGLAVREEDYLGDARMVGTPAYMSPEQARCEGHRLDGRSDVFSLGVVFYLMLCGKKPFRGTTNEMLYQVISVDPAPPSQIDSKVPPELERICLRAISKRASDRYQTSAAFAEDLESWHSGTRDSGGDFRITPKGLRSFDGDDADFFLNLLPGPRDRHGLPDSIRFWKQRLEETDPERTFGVGLLYGPSGCGKSSVIKAGLIPRLSQNLTVLYLEATPAETEIRLIRGLRRKVSDLPRSLGLVESFSYLRKRESGKVVVILDQFEQWLHVHRAEQDTELVRALRQCDGGKVQAVVMVRDDFSMAASRFMRELESRIVEGHNFSMVDLFSIEHAAHVLTRFGQAFGCLPVPPQTLSDENKEFVSLVSSRLARDGKVISVRLALFAEMVKDKQWVPATLEEVGGTRGVGVHFLEGIFGETQTHPDHKTHHVAARKVLMALLPEVGSDIKGHMRSYTDLLEVSGYAQRTDDFDELLRLLDGKLRLITPTDPKGGQSDSESSRERDYFQLTHDYLVPSLRDWLTRQQKGTRRGRAELKLAERAVLWDTNRENRYLPSFNEWVAIKWWTSPGTWSDAQKAMMDKAGRVIRLRSAWLATAVLLLLAVFLFARRSAELNHREAQVSGYLKTLAKAKIDQVPSVVRELQPDRGWSDAVLMEKVGLYPADSNERLNLSLALLPDGPAETEEQAEIIDYVYRRMLRSPPQEALAIRGMLERCSAALVDDLWRIVLEPAENEKAMLLQASSALALFDNGHAENWEKAAPQIAERLVNESALRAAVWSVGLRDSKRHLINPLGGIYRRKGPGNASRQVELATEVLEDYASDDLDALADLLFDGTPEQFVVLYDEFADFGDAAREKTREERERRLVAQWEDRRVEPAWKPVDGRAIETIEDAEGAIESDFGFVQTLPLEQFADLAADLSGSGYRPVRVRPYEYGRTVGVAAVWKRDGGEWRFEAALSREGMLDADNRNRRDGFVPVDVSGYVEVKAGKRYDRYCAVWKQMEGDDASSQMFVGQTRGDLDTVRSGLIGSGYQVCQTMQAFRSIGGQRQYCGIYSEGGVKSAVLLRHSDKPDESVRHLDSLVWDFDVSRVRAIEEDGTPSEGVPGNREAEQQSDEKWEASQRDTLYTVKVLNPRILYESRESIGLGPSEHLEDCVDLTSRGFRMVAISVVAINGSLRTASVWHRPLVSSEKREHLASRQANALIAAYRLGEEQVLSRRMGNSRDPRIESWVIDRFVSMTQQETGLTEQLRLGLDSVGIDSARRRALILILGSSADQIAGPQDQIKRWLLDSYENDNDPGVHAASEWALRMFGEERQLEAIDHRLSTGMVEAGRRWCLNRQGKAFSLIDGPADFLMGSPGSEPHRDTDEYLHRKRVNRSFAISTKEVTVDEFHRFLDDHPAIDHGFSARQAPSGDCPQLSVTWYEAAAYCRWLSEKENVPEDEMCYPPVGEIKEGMVFPRNYLSRTGYRLPSEAEWEYACRAMATTSRYYGESDQLLTRYAWFRDNSGERSHPVGRLIPNRFGLFDMLGNVQEWCHERKTDYRGAQDASENDVEDLEPVGNSVRRMLRGGAFGILGGKARSAARGFNRPENRYSNSGFRIVRTLSSDGSFESGR